MRVKSAIEQTVIYGVLMVLLAMMILFGISTAEKGINSLVGSDDPQALAVNATPQGQVDLKILGKDISTTQVPWADQLSDNLEGQESFIAGFMDDLSLSIGTWMQVGAKTLLESIGGLTNH